jgi:hypothetical protein
VALDSAAIALFPNPTSVEITVIDATTLAPTQLLRRW